MAAVAEDKPVEVVGEEDDDDMPELEENTGDNSREGGAEDDSAGGKQNRSEKKARKAIQKLGMKPVEGIHRVTVRKARTFCSYQKARSVQAQLPAYVIFGEAKSRTWAHSNKQPQRNNSSKHQSSHKQPPKTVAAENNNDDDDAEEDGEVDETGVEAKDIDLVMAQASVSRAKVKALKNNDNDIISRSWS